MIKRLSISLLSLWAYGTSMCVSADDLDFLKLLEGYNDTFDPYECIEGTIYGSDVPMKNMMYVLNVGGPNTASISLLVLQSTGFSVKFQKPTNYMFNNAFTMVYIGTSPDTDALHLKLCNASKINNAVYVKVGLLPLK